MKAVVVPAGGTSPTLTELAAYAGERLARYKCPTVLLVVDDIPRGPVGKALRRSVR